MASRAGRGEELRADLAAADAPVQALQQRFGLGQPVDVERDEQPVARRRSPDGSGIGVVLLQAAHLLLALEQRLDGADGRLGAVQRR